MPNKESQQSKQDTKQGCQRLLQCCRCKGYGHRQSECPTKVSFGKDHESSTHVSQNNQKNTPAMVPKFPEDAEEVFTCVKVERPRSSGNSKKISSDRLTTNDEPIYSAACHAQSYDCQIYIGVSRLNGRPVYYEILDVQG